MKSVAELLLEEAGDEAIVSLVAGEDDKHWRPNLPADMPRNTLLTWAEAEPYLRRVVVKVKSPPSLIAWTALRAIAVVEVRDREGESGHFISIPRSPPAIETSISMNVILCWGD